MTTLAAPAKINLALVVGPRRDDGKHELVTVYERIQLTDTLSLEPSDELDVEGFPADTLVRQALMALASVAGVEPAWRITIDKRIPVRPAWAAAAQMPPLALSRTGPEQPLAAATPTTRLPRRRRRAPLPHRRPQLGEETARNCPLAPPRDYCVLVLLPEGEQKPRRRPCTTRSMTAVATSAYAERRDELMTRLKEAAVKTSRWPKNDLPALHFRMSSRAWGRAVTSAPGRRHGVFGDEGRPSRKSPGPRPGLDRDSGTLIDGREPAIFIDAPPLSRNCRRPAVAAPRKELAPREPARRPRHRGRRGFSWLEDDFSRVTDRDRHQ